MRIAWPHQLKAVEWIIDAHRRGVRRVVVVIPTGGGKSYVFEETSRRYLEQGDKAILYTNRRALIDQLSRDTKLRHGVRMAGRGRTFDNFQIASLQTENERVFKRGVWDTFPANFVGLDECHLHTGKMARRIISRHYAADAMCVGLTATPLDLDDMYDEMFVAASVSDLRACGANVTARHYGMDEPDMREWKLEKAIPDTLSEAAVTKAIMTKGIFGRVLDSFNQLNPDRRPSIGFGPGIRESIGFAQAFSKAGIRSCHIDGEDIWVDGELHKHTATLRDEVFAESKSGRIVCIWNRFILREGIDLPWLSHGIFATIFTSLQSYLQSGGRLLRGYNGLEYVTVQDHGGNWWRHGSLNTDRDWKLGMRASWATELRYEAIRNSDPKEPEPWSCPRCNKVMTGTTCECGYKREFQKYPRRVRQSDGTLVEHVVPQFQPQKVALRRDTQKIWTDCYFRALRSRTKMTFRQARALFVHENYYYPPATLKLMPRDSYTWFLRVRDVPREELL